MLEHFHDLSARILPLFLDLPHAGLHRSQEILSGIHDRVVRHVAAASQRIHGGSSLRSLIRPDIMLAFAPIIVRVESAVRGPMTVVNADDQARELCLMNISLDLFARPSQEANVSRVTKRSVVPAAATMIGEGVTVLSPCKER